MSHRNTVTNKIINSQIKVDCWGFGNASESKRNKDMRFCIFQSTTDDYEEVNGDFTSFFVKKIEKMNDRFVSVCYYLSLFLFKNGNYLNYFLINFHFF